MRKETDNHFKLAFAMLVVIIVVAAYVIAVASSFPAKMTSDTVLDEALSDTFGDRITGLVQYAVIVDDVKSDGKASVVWKNMDTMERIEKIIQLPDDSAEQIEKLIITGSSIGNRIRFRYAKDTLEDLAARSSAARFMAEELIAFSDYSAAKEAEQYAAITKKLKD